MQLTVIVLLGLISLGLGSAMVLGQARRRLPPSTMVTPEPATAREDIAAQIAAAMLAARHEALEQARIEAAELLGRAEREAGEAYARAERERADVEAERDRARREAGAAEALRHQIQDAIVSAREQARKIVVAATGTAGELEAKARAQLEQVAGLTRDEARAALIADLERDARREAVTTIRRIEAEATEQADERAREIVGLAIQRVASGTTTESVVQAVHLPSEDYKGRIIGREGRNIRAFEQVTGVNVLIDDTPDAVLISCFDPVRREIGRLTLEALIADGRVHPHRVEEQYDRSKAAVEALMVKAARDALADAGISEVHPEIERLLGRLRYRTSYGQNVLAHLVETAHIASGIAHELHLPDRSIQIIKRGAFLHDLGKAVTHEVEGSHALVGAELARKHGEEPDVVHAIEAHHQEIAPRTLEAWLTIASDSCSGGRPGARRESVEAYLERMERIEQIAKNRDGVERVYAMSAGRELRVMVLPDQVDDAEAQVIARDIARQVEDELTYPGQIRVTVIRESRATETAR